MWYKNNGEGDTASASAAAPTPLNTEVPMKWQRSKVQWKASGFEDHQHVSNQIKWWSLQPVNKISATNEYIVEDEQFNVSAELARVFENISQQVAEGHDTRPPLSYLLTCCSFMWKRGADKKPLTPTKIKHNDAFAQIQRFTQTWASNWGHPIFDAKEDEWHLADFLKMSATFYYAYSNIDNLEAEDIDEINNGIREHCDVGLKHLEGTKDYLLGVVPINLLGYCWRSLADDIANKKEYRICARKGCTRVFKAGTRPDKQSCGNSCSTMISRSKGAEAADRESIFIGVGK